MARVTLSRLTKTYPAARKSPAFTAVKGIDLEIRDGEFMVLVGPSGCGKSTTLRMIAGLEDITAGTIAIGDEIVNDQLPKDRGIAMVFQNYALYPHMTVAENMAFALKLAKTPRSEIDQRVAAAAETLGLTSMLDRKPAALSGGQRQRVAVGRAIVRQPQVFLFDEPLSNLDAKMRVAMRTEISRLHDQLRTTMIYVTHDQVEAMTMGDRICVMRGGEIMQVADPLTLYRQPANAYVAGFIGSPPMNLIHGRLESRAGGPFFVENSDGSSRMEIGLSGTPAADLAALAPHADVILGIRPEAITTEPHSGTARIEGTIELSEPMGAETHLHVRTAAHTVIARVHADARFNAGTSQPLFVDLAKLHAFDAATEQAIRATP
ncbi:ABC transporter ATP-binding protein [Synoicihabitans lomoniglobus]|uniref:Sn-glycerol-3-phosphate ABC transporter ATP-binding protein UgpC n=1 Tax=Synoicihabitans lomoniglobus TaxID=2909285 RepID=A0AAF0CMJ1_9BACT|nr:sn-glycerol-3-phosphate ABC transporter ATP-binding protein UgpC [Opitutaceae bacterium LMO-M01]WED64203.1 sn-glycerol-3-phosphate ABC transporter ATP-binding protein UgpC [Opitutaceae bacterium LMO-M01]